MLERRINEVLSGVTLADLLRSEPEVYQIAGVAAGLAETQAARFA
jgi:hypothetical protein